MPFEWLVQLVPPLKTRAFSISSSPSAHPNQVHLTVNVVSWTTPFKRKRTGLCSTWLAGLDPQDGMCIHNATETFQLSNLCHLLYNNIYLNEQVYIFQHGFAKAPFLLHQHRFPLYLLVLVLAAPLFVDL